MRGGTGSACASTDSSGRYLTLHHTLVTAFEAQLGFAVRAHARTAGLARESANAARVAAHRRAIGDMKLIYTFHAVVLAQWRLDSKLASGESVQLQAGDGHLRSGGAACRMPSERSIDGVVGDSFELSLRAFAPRERLIEFSRPASPHAPRSCSELAASGARAPRCRASRDHARDGADSTIDSCDLSVSEPGRQHSSFAPHRAQGGARAASRERRGAPVSPARRRSCALTSSNVTHHGRLVLFKGDRRLRGPRPER